MNRFPLHFFFILSLVWGCTEAPLITDQNPDTLNAPVTFAFVPGTNLGVIANANVNLSEEEGSLVAVDLDARKILTDTKISLRNFSGRMAFDVARKHLLIADRGDDSLLVYSYAVPGAGGTAISFKAVNVTDPAERTPNGIKTDKGPYDVMLQLGTSHGDVAYTTNAESGTVSVIKLENLTPIDYQIDKEKLRGIPLISAANFRQKDSGHPPGEGANLIVPSPTTGLLFITSTISNNLFVLNPMNQTVEAMLDLSEISPTGGMRGLAIDNNEIAYLVSRSLGGILVLDVSNVVDDGIEFNVVDARFIDLIPTGRQPEGVALTTDQKRLFVSDLGENKVTIIDTASRRILDHVTVSGRSPGEIILDSARGVFYVLNFLSNSIDVLDETTGALLETIK